MKTYILTFQIEFDFENISFQGHINQEIQLILKYGFKFLSHSIRLSRPLHCVSEFEQILVIMNFYRLPKPF